jgi:hypothetical protein
MALVASLISARAGDAIVFSPDKAKAAPGTIPPNGKQGPTVVEKLRPSDLDVDPDRGSRPQASPSKTGPRTREDRIRQAELDEKRNWLLLRPGELQEEEAKKENNLGVRDHDKWGDKVDANGRRDYTFRGLGEGKRDNTKEGPQAPGNNPQTTQGEGAPDQAPEETAPSNTKKPGLSPHSAQELDFRGFFSGDDSKEKENGAKTAVLPTKEDETAAMMKEFIGNPSAARSREQQERVDKFNLMLKTPPSALARSFSAGAGSSESARPVAPAPAIADSPARFGGAPLQIPSGAQRPDSAAGLRGQPAAGAWNDPNSLRGMAPNRSGPGGAGNNPWDANLLQQQQQQLNKPSVARPLVIEPPSRRL